MLSTVRYQTPIAPSYFRNNRSTRQKSMRCFPSCSVKGHVNGGKCGIPLCVEIEMANMPCNFGEFIFVAELRPSKTPRLSGMVQINKATLMDQLRNKSDKTNTTGELFLADIDIIAQTIDGGVCAQLTFNAQHCSWDYAWKSNRWSGPIEYHVVDIVALRSINAQEYAVCASHESEPFIIVSSHKRPSKDALQAPAVPRVAKGLSKLRSSVSVDSDTMIYGETADETTRALQGSRGGGGTKRSSSSSRSHSAFDDEAAHALMSLVRPTSYFFDISKSLTQRGGSGETATAGGEDRAGIGCSSADFDRRMDGGTGDDEQSHTESNGGRAYEQRQQAEWIQRKMPRRSLTSDSESEDSAIVLLSSARSNLGNGFQRTTTGLSSARTALSHEGNEEAEEEVQEEEEEYIMLPKR